MKVAAQRSFFFEVGLAELLGGDTAMHAVGVELEEARCPEAAVGVGGQGQRLVDLIDCTEGRGEHVVLVVEFHGDGSRRYGIDPAF